MLMDKYLLPLTQNATAISKYVEKKYTKKVNF